MRRKKIAVLMIAAAVSAMTVACGPTGAQGHTEVQTESVEKETGMAETTGAVKETSEESQETEVKETTEPTGTTQETENAAGVSFEELWGMLGMDDADTADLFGGGEENWTSDKKFYIGRNYEVTLYDGTYSAHTSCDDNKKVNAVSVWLSEEGNEVTKEEAEVWAERITAETETEPTYNDTQSEAGSKSWKWVFDKKIITMYQTGDLLSVNMNVAVGELK